MKTLISIIMNGLILYVMTYFLAENAGKWIQAGIILGCGDCSYTSLAAMKSYFIWWVLLGLINMTVRPILKILSLPFFFLFFGLASFVINGVVLYLFTYIINTALKIPWVWYEINGLINFAIAVAIFTVLNTLYGVLFFKK